jgi:hypothetical protein
MVSDSFALKNNNKALRADFLIPTQAFVGDTVVCLDITKPVPDLIAWFLPNEMEQILSNETSIQFIPYYEGNYEIKMLAIAGECKNIVNRNLKIFKKQDSEDTETAYGYKERPIQRIDVFPNPNFGHFTIEIATSKAIVNGTPIKINILRNATGESVYQESTLFDIKSNSTLKKEIRINVFSGMYSLVIEVNKQQYITKLAILNY